MPFFGVWKKVWYQKFGGGEGGMEVVKKSMLFQSLVVFFFFGDGSVYVSKINFRRSFYWSFISTFLTSCVLSKIPSRPKGKVQNEWEPGRLWFFGIWCGWGSFPSWAIPFWRPKGEFHPAGSNHDTLVKSGSWRSFIKILIPKDTATKRTLESSPGFSQQKYVTIPQLAKRIFREPAHHQKPPRKFGNPPEQAQAFWHLFSHSERASSASAPALQAIAPSQADRFNRKNGELCILIEVQDT